ncbi:rRNA maturation RNase YbeY [Winogradskyella aurantiaca]|uniref:rRNA maturation RNase YbeY n=1 Tax=Winogradskyella aurantiaca TaxID=2219558 RepID=UPI000E1E05F0|nr:rRNA maturation RNase YbeY [Winogradskyella aurantiaca]
MISYNIDYPFELLDEDKYSHWIQGTIELESHELGELSYTFVTDDVLHQMNVDYLDHDTLTDIISFDYTVGKVIQGDVFISVDRVKDNAKDFEVDFENELARVMIHGVLHYCGYKDKTDSEKELMRSKENFYLGLLAK